MSLFFGGIVLKILFDCLKTKNLTVDTVFKKVLFIYLAVSISVYNGYAVKLGSASISINTAFRYVLFVIAVLLLMKKRSHFMVLKLSVFLWGSVLIGVIGCIISPYSGYVICDIAQWDWVVTGDKTLEHITDISPNFFKLVFGLLQFTVILSVAYGKITKEEVRKSTQILYDKWMPLILGYGILELLFKKCAHIDLSRYVLPILFGSTSEIGPLYRLQGFAKEPAQYAMMLFIYSVIALIDYQNKSSGCIPKLTRNRTLFCMRICLIYLLMAASNSLIAYYLIILSVGCILIYSRIDIKILTIIVVVILIGLIIVLGIPNAIMIRVNRITLVLNALKRGIVYHSHETSEGARLMSIYYSFAGLLARPLFGIGIGEIDAHTMFFTILANLGMVGSCLYFRIWAIFGNVHSRQKKATFIMIVASTFLFGGIGYFMELYFPFLLLALPVKGDQL